MMAFREVNEAVLAADGPMHQIGFDTVQELKLRASRCAEKRSRLLLHGDASDTLHEMLIVLPFRQIFPPHRNERAAKSYTIIEGALACVLFTDAGAAEEVCVLNATPGGRHFLLRLNETRWHTVVPLTSQIVFIETTLGPFQTTEYASWAPKNTETSEGAAYYSGLRNQVSVAARNQEPDTDWDRMIHMSGPDRD